jgi:PAB-dependent poly(A)-specific ribonuclease subunit 2
MYGDENQYYYGSEHSGPEGGFGMNAHGPTQGDGMREIGVNCIHDGYSFHDGVSSVCFDIVEESVWTGSVRGSLYQHVGPSLEYYSCVNTASFHEDGASYGDSITHMKSLGHSIVSISAGQFNMHMSGGSARVCYLDGLGDMGDFMYQHWNHKVIIGRHGGGVFTYDVMRGSVGASYDTHHGVVALAGPMGSGQIAMASPEGYLTMFDPRQAKISGHGCMSESKLYAHGFASMESSGHLIATAGYSGLADRPVLEPMIKLFDSRMGVKQLSSIPFSNGPSLLKFHPTLKSTLLACSASGIFGMVDTSGAVSSHTDTYFIDMQGDTVSSCDISSNGDCIVFGGANGYIHLWSTLSQPVFVSGIMPDYASPLDSSTIHSMDENSSFALAPLYMSPDGEQYASYVEENETMSVGLPSRVVDASLLQIGKQSEFVTYIENPKYDENNPIGTSAASVSSMRNKRIRHRRTGKETEAAIHERAQRREKEGGVVLPRKFGKISIRQQKGSRFEEFDFKVHNTTPFSGLENGIANCYMNALIQILYFCRPLRDFALRCPPDPEKEFSLLGEISLLFHMLASSQGEVCQVSVIIVVLVVVFLVYACVYFILQTYIHTCIYCLVAGI